MSPGFSEILAELPTIEAEAESLRDVLLANLVMIGETPAPTFDEGERIELLLQRFGLSGLQNSSTDEGGNGLGVLPGENGEDNILVVAHADTVFSRQVDHTITVHQDRLVGPGVADNSLGLAVLATLPSLFKHLGLRLQSNLVLMATAASLGRGDLAGLRFFLANNKLPIRAATCVEGMALGRLSYSSLGMLRGEITCSVPEEYDWTRFGATNAIINLNEVINRIMKIPLPRRPRTTVVMGSIEGGASFNTIPTHAVLRFEIRSESAEMVDEIAQRMEDIAEEVASDSGAAVNVDIFARRRPGGIGFSHPLARRTRSIIRALGVQPRMSPSFSELAALIDNDIPAVTVGITTGERLAELGESVLIAPMAKGIAQLLGILLAIDRGYCDEG